VSGLRTLKPKIPKNLEKPKNLKTFSLQNLGFFQPCLARPVSSKTSAQYGLTYFCAAR